MLPAQGIKTAVEIQQKSYRLLLWLADAIDRGIITFTHIHQYTGAADAAWEWFEEHYNNLPDAGRPERDRLREFSNYFGSYGTTSFDLVEQPGTRLETPCGCYCPFCTHLANTSHLRPKKPGKRDKD